jgi:glycerol kinase
MGRYVLSIDQGTTSSRAFIYNEKFEVVGQGQHPFPQIYPQTGWVEHDLEEIWKSVESSILDAVKSAEKSPEFSSEAIAAIGITNQRETFGLWDRKSLKPVGNAVVWQCNRSEQLCAKLKKTALGREIEKKTGLKISPYFSGTKLSFELQRKREWMLKAKRGELCFGTIDTFLLQKLSGGKIFATDISNASRTLLMDIRKQGWDKKILKALKIPERILPVIQSSDAKFGKTSGLKCLPDGIDICGILGDQQAALFGQTCFAKGEGKITYGTGAFMLINTAEKIYPTKTGVTTVAWKYNGKTTYALEASVFIAGAAVQFLRDNLNVIEKSSEIEGLARTVADADGVFFIPALTGLGSPYWRPEAKGLLGGLTRATSKAHIARACLEGIALSVGEVFAALVQDSKSKLKSIRVDGGASRNRLLMQEQADLLRVRVERPRDVETTVKGAAFMAALSCGLVKNLPELKKLVETDGTWTAACSQKESQRRFSVWKRRVAALLSGAY